MTTKHTPGPWSIQGQWQLKTDTNEWVDAECVEAPKWGIIGAWVDASCDESAANARLVAAAPELLESLAGIVATLEGAWNEKALTAPRYIQCQLGEEVKRAISAIKKAEGRA